MRETPVLIAGGGPVGMTLARVLAHHGVRCLLVERNETTTRHPKMDITNGRSMELFRRVGLIDALRAAGVPESHPFDVSWITSLSGHELHRFRYPSVVEARREILARNDGTQAREPAMRVSQIVIEPVLRRAIEAEPLVEARWGVAFEALEQESDGVTATLRDAAGGLEQVRGRYLVGCDGGGSAVRGCLGIRLDGTPRVANRFVTHFRSRARDVLQRWGVTWHYQSAFGTLIAQDDDQMWTLQSRFPVGEPERVDPTALLASFAGAPFEHEILVANAWTPHLLVAEAYGRGRVFLAGDAAHQYIPTGGYGMNTGIGDAFDLGWKLAAVLRGFGGPGLLASYEPERRPVGLRNRAASARHTEVRIEIGRLYGPGLMAPGATGDAARAEAAARIARIGNAENESWGIELGYHYATSPVVCGEPEAVPSDDPLRYAPTTTPGARLPSVFLRDGSALFDHLGPWFTLLDFGGAGAAGRALAEAARRRGMPLRVVSVDEPALAAIYERRLVLVRPDQHVAWRGEALDHVEADAVVARVLGWSGPGVP